MNQTPLVAPRASLIERQFRDGNVSHDELGALVGLVEHFKPQKLMEIGTFDGRTTCNLAMASPDNAVIYSLDLPSGQRPVFTTSLADECYISCAKPMRYLSHPGLLQKIVQLYGDSGTYDFGFLQEQVDFVFIDGCHTADYVKRDSVTAYKLIGRSGVLVWHDYECFPAVTRLISLLDNYLPSYCKLTRIVGTHLVYHVLLNDWPRFEINTFFESLDAYV